MEHSCRKTEEEPGLITAQSYPNWNPVSTCKQPGESPLKMGEGVPQSFLVAAVAVLAAIFFSWGVCNGETIYAEKGSSPELPCPCPSCSGGHPREVSWYFEHQGSTIPLFHKLKNSHVIERLPASWDRLEVLQNYALRFHNLTNNDTGRYWCELGNYYDLVVVSGRKLILESSEANTTCYVLSCSVSDKMLFRDVASWWEGGERLLKEDKGREYSIFRGQTATQLHICLKKETSGKETKERRVKCQFAQKTEITFTLTVNEQDFCPAGHMQPIPQAKDYLSPQCPESRGNERPWIPLAVCVVLQFLIIFALGVTLWRRTRRKKHEEHLKGLKGKDVSKSEYKPQVYENVKNRREML